MARTTTRIKPTKPIIEAPATPVAPADEAAPAPADGAAPLPIDPKTMKIIHAALEAAWAAGYEQAMKDFRVGKFGMKITQA